MEVRREQLDVGGTVVSGLVSALENDRSSGCDPFIDFVWRKNQEFVYGGAE